MIGDLVEIEILKIVSVGISSLTTDTQYLYYFPSKTFSGRKIFNSLVGNFSFS